VVHGVKGDRAAKLRRMCPSCREADHRSTITSSHCEDSCSAGTMTTANPAAVHRENTLKAKLGRPYLLVVIRQLLLLSGDVELNPGPLDGEYSSVNYRTWSTFFSCACCCIGVDFELGPKGRASPGLQVP
jgi:hypothetical protein